MIPAAERRDLVNAHEKGRGPGQHGKGHDAVDPHCERKVSQARIAHHAHQGSPKQCASVGTFSGTDPTLRVAGRGEQDPRQHQTGQTGEDEGVTPSKRLGDKASDQERKQQADIGAGHER